MEITNKNRSGCLPTPWLRFSPKILFQWIMGINGPHHSHARGCDSPTPQCLWGCIQPLVSITRHPTSLFLCISHCLLQRHFTASPEPSPGTLPSLPLSVFHQHSAFEGKLFSPFFIRIPFIALSPCAVMQNCEE